MAVFKTRARALDMLGRQQIAGIPTAISELFKNAHDAYADNAEVDYYRSDGLFLLRDDGVGMTQEEFEARWLTLGTESKVRAVAGISPPPVDPGKKKRPILGEKGIGRLAIGAIGPQVLVLTRADRDGLETNLTAAFIQWSLFQCPGIDLDQIEVPIRSFERGTLPNKKDVDEMVAAVRKNLISLKKRLEAETFKRIEAELQSFSVDPAILDKSLGAPSLAGSGKGTHFFVMPSDPSLIAAIQEKPDDDSATALTKMLLGFTNTMTPGHPEPSIKTVFRDHKTDDSAEDLIEELAFFTPDEFQNADHHIEGRFDDYGQFLGTVSVYGEDHENHVVAWDEARGQQTECGPFSINVAYVQGKSSESTIPAAEWTRIARKLNQLGGLYIYRDDIRILPYGNNDYDFLDIEKNRTKSASYYYFSYRRMVGVIQISQANNAQLSEKAGREGFRENKAYRQFRAILKNFFLQVAADFFREGSASAEGYLRKKAEIDRLEQARRRREKQLTARRSEFDRQLQAFFSSVQSAAPQTDAASVLESLSSQIKAATKIVNRDEASRMVIDAESSAFKALEEIRKRYRVVRPSGVGLSKQLRRDWESAVVEVQRLEKTIFQPAADDAVKIVGELAERAKLDVSMRLRMERAISDRITDTQRRASSERKEANEALDSVNSRVRGLTREIVEEVEAAIANVRSDFARFDLAGLQDKVIVDKRNSLESKLMVVADRNLESLNSITEDLKSLHWTRDEDGRFVGMNVMNESIQEDILAMRERSEADLELTQLGMALNVVNHEFETSIKAVRNSLRRLRSWADVNQDLQGLYDELRTSFDHIDGYLSLFTPLQRRLYRTAVDISGADIAKFLQDLFSRRFEKHEIGLQLTHAFLKHTIHGYPSSFYPVFVNLIDNAIFWLRDRAAPRTIKLDVDGNVMLVADNGPGVPERDREAIFELGFTRKPGGRGLGLHISREVLGKVGFLLNASSAPTGTGAVFRIVPETLSKVGVDK